MEKLSGKVLETFLNIIHRRAGAEGIDAIPVVSGNGLKFHLKTAEFP